jgi:guanylate kinase
MNKVAARVLVIGGPTGGGKDTIVALLVKKYPQFARLVTATTRAPRAYEKHEHDYYFFTKDEFNAASANGAICEQTYFANRDEYYGTYKPDLEKKIASGIIPIAVTDRIGARYMKENYGASTLCIIPTPFASLHERFRSREPDATEEWILRRMDNARDEIEEGKGNFDYFVDNEFGQLDATVVRVEDILAKEGYL